MSAQDTKVAVVTGTSSGIGRAAAEAFLAAGWRVVGAARRDASIDHAAYVHHRVDLGDARDIARFAEAVVDPLFVSDAGRIALVNNAARVGALARVRDAAMDGLAALLALNAAAPITLMGRCVARRRDGVALRIVNISSGAAHTPIPGLSDYCATKAALRIAGQTLALELEVDGVPPQDVALLSYEPGLVETAMQELGRGSDPAVFPSQPVFAGFREDGLVVSPDEVVGAIVDFAESSAPSGHFSEARFERS